MEELRPGMSGKDGLRSFQSKLAAPWGRSAKELAQDDIVMATNSSSIVSKRSVEKIYYPNEPHFLQHFVKKFQRRSPLINRGYHIRMHVIDKKVRDFLRRPSVRTKVIVNLGCGSDVLPWQCWTRYPDICRGAKFVDIDFPNLMKQKCKTVQSTPELRDLLGDVSLDEDGQVLLMSDRYIQIGCDLRELDKLESLLSSMLELPKCTFILVAEVSITYMETEGADDVLRWASCLGESEFCLLEQILPSGPEHPFARTMLNHFNNLNAPPRSAFAYPTLQAQTDRFGRLGWSYVDAQSLWQIWSNDEYFSTKHRKQLNDAEPFDEWEEFALYASHYVVVSAKTMATKQIMANFGNRPASIMDKTAFEDHTSFHPYEATRGQRRFGAAVKTANASGESTISNIFGLGTATRLRSQDNYSQDHLLETVDIPPEGPASRMCHAVANLEGSGSILCGGRLSPSRALKDAWFFSSYSNGWSQLNDLPIPLYRHSITKLGTNLNLTLVIGGKTGSSSIFPGCVILRDSKWIDCHIMGNYKPVFGAVLLSLPRAEELPTALRFHGILQGGMLEDGTIADQALHWTAEVPSNDEIPTISFKPLVFENATVDIASTKLINRFGAAGVLLDGHDIAIIGGIIANELLTPANEIARLKLVSDPHSSRMTVHMLPPIKLTTSNADMTIPRPLLVGISAAITDTGNLLIMGGGAVCFSMGSFWNPGSYIIRMKDNCLELVGK